MSGAHGEITISSGDELVAIAPGIWVESPLRVSETGSPAHDYDVELELVAEAPSGCRGGRFVCRELKVHQREGGPPVTLAGIRSIPIAHLSRAAQLKVYVVDLGQGHDDFVGDLKSAPANLRLVHPFLKNEDLAAIHASGPTDEALRWVAKIYRLAVVMGDPPTREVESVLELPRSTAGRWIALARERGFLGKAEGPGKAGG